VITGRARKMAIAVAVGAVVATSTAGSTAFADGSEDSGVAQDTLHEQLTGYEETPVALSTTGNGRFLVQVDERRQEVFYELSYTSLEGTVTQAHIHFGARAQTGGISVFLCTNLGNGPAGTQVCPAAPATVSGTLTPGDVIGPVGQGITAGQFGEFLDAVRAGTAYVNVHSTLYPAGEIRAQLGHHH
jgi:hypothetical protein